MSEMGSQKLCASQINQAPQGTVHLKSEEYLIEGDGLLCYLCLFVMWFCLLTLSIYKIASHAKTRASILHFKN